MIINSRPLTPSSVVVSFSWTPAQTFGHTASNGVSFSVPKAVFNTATTFTATTTITNPGRDISGPLSIVEYRWDFGDGIVKYGNPATHTYIIANPELFTVLRVTDSKGRRWFARAQMYVGALGGSASLPLLLVRAP